MQKMIRRGVIRRRAAVLLGAGMLACPAVSRAATYTWDGGDSTYGLLTVGDNWVGNSAPYSGTSGTADIVFGVNNPHGYSPTLSGNLDAHSLTFNSSALAYNIVTNGSGFSGVLSLEAGGLIDNASNLESLTGSTAVVVNANQTWNIAGGRFVDSTPLNLSSNTLTVNTSAAGSASFTGTLSGVLGSTSLIKTGPGVLNLNASSSMVGNLLLQAGTTQLSGGSLTVNPFAGAAVTVTGAASFNVNSGAFVGIHAFGTGAAGLIVDGGSTVVVTGVGSQLIATVNSPVIQVGYNTSGAVAVSAGAFFNATTLSLGAGAGSTGTATVDGSSTINLNTLLVASLATTTGSLTITNGGTVTVASLTYFGSNNSSISISTGGGSLNTAGLSSDVTGLGSIALTDPSGGNALNINGSSGTNSYSGSISGTGSLNKSGGSTQILSGSDSFSGNVLVSGGTLALGSSNLFSKLTIGTGGTLELNPSGGFSSSLPINIDGGTLAYNASTATLSNPINLTANGGTFNVPSGITLTTTGILNGPSGTLTKTGPGTLNLALSNSSSNAISALQLNAGLTQLTSGSLMLTPGALSGIGLNNTNFNISGGATLATGGLYTAGLDGGTVTVTGNGSSLKATLGLAVDGTASLIVTKSASASTGNFTLFVGDFGAGTLTVISGSSVTAGTVILADNPGSTGTATIDGAGSTLTARDIEVGGAGQIGGTAAISITNGGSVTTATTNFNSTASFINASGGTLNTGSLSSFNSGFGSIALTDPFGVFALNINGSSGTSTYSGAISGTGSLNKSGGSTQILSGTNTFTGSVQVNGGALVLNSANSFTSLEIYAGTAQVSAGTLTLAGPGVIPLYIDGPTAVLNISNGAVINATGNPAFYVPVKIDAGGTVNVSGTGSQIVTPSLSQGFEVGGFSPGANVLNLTSGGSLTSAYYLEVGGYSPISSGTVNIGSGGSVTTPIAAVGFTSETTGAVNINGSGSVLNVSHNLEVGGSPDFGIYGGTGIITATNGGAISALVTTFYSNTATINISGGTLTTGSLNSNSSGNGAIILTDPASGFALNINGSLTTNVYSGSISGTGSIEKTGTSLQGLSGNDTFTGAVLVSAGTLRLSSPNKFTSLVITGGTVQVTGTGNILNVPTLAVIAGGTLDITNDSADISASSLSVINGLAQKGFNNGLWTGTGLTSSNAAADTRHLTAVGVIQNNQGGTPLYTASHPFEGTTPGVSDILAKYTYYGDTNLDGKVDGSDYSRIDSAFVADKTNPTAVTGWYNGDFNYDGVTNGSDYTLIDNAFNTQGALISAEFASPTAAVANLPATAVPEPGSMSLLLLAGLLSRRSRRRSTT